ncbi:restriction endonuclease subunit S [Fibrobacter sp.]|uniref:restriction endonuclease subunit S n=1 Tax=Fibrobacter sp. TaxID=35828 RepID=UPI00260C4BB8|nr:restriction endonuclease subunit S [Fibrobacter sp.]MDD5942597.1 restriction endonuclease subunit S [Fibrobacter sp.]
MIPLIDIFDVWYGVNLEVVNSEVVSAGIPFVSRQSVNNGVVCHVKKMDDVEPNPSHTLSIAVSGSVLSTFYHDYEYYSGRDIYVAKPKIKLTKEEMLYYCYVIEQNKYRYNYGRGANKTFRSILVPSKDEIPKYVRIKEAEIRFCNKPIISNKIKLNTDSWKWFRYDEIFEICKGFYNKKPEENPIGDIPFIGATDSNNGITSMHDLDTIKDASKTGDEPNAPLEQKIFKSNCITVSNNGSVGYAFYQPKEFTCTHDVNPLYIHKKWNKELNIYIAMFLCSLIEKERFRWDYGRKWRPKRMPDSLIKLPVRKITPNEYEPDWQFMEDYIKSLPYSSSL